MTKKIDKLIVELTALVFIAAKKYFFIDENNEIKLGYLIGTGRLIKDVPVEYVLVTSDGTVYQTTIVWKKQLDATREALHRANDKQKPE